MSNIKIIADNRVDSASSIVATSEASGHLVTETQNDFKVKTWRSTTLATQTITITWAAGQALGGLGLPFNNLILNSTVQVKLYTLSGDVVAVLDTGAITVTHAYDPPVGFSTIGSDSFAVGGGNYFSTFFTETTAQKVEIIITSSGNPDGYIELSRIVLGKEVTFAIGVDKGITYGYSDSTKVVTTDAGDSLADRGVTTKSLKFSLSTMPAADKTIMHNLVRRVGNAIPVYISVFPSATDAEELINSQIYGRFKGSFSSSLFLHGFYRTSIAIEEF